LEKPNVLMVFYKLRCIYELILDASHSFIQNQFIFPAYSAGLTIELRIFQTNLDMDLKLAFRLKKSLRLFCANGITSFNNGLALVSQFVC
jgi:hypothetical protein